jgi:cold shock CspA family protein
MARPQDALNKKEFEKKKLQKRKDKEKRREERKSKPATSFEDMIAYMDENGNITSTPPDPSRKKTTINENDIIIGARNSEALNPVDLVHKGKVTFFNNGKGYGFIKDLASGESIFVHSNDLLTSIKENDMVTFETQRGPKGPMAVNVKVTT